MRRIRAYGGYFQEFMQTLNVKVQRKIDYALLLLKTQERLSNKFVKAIKDVLFELRIEYESNIYRVFFILTMGKSWCCSTAFRKRPRRHPSRK
jgi:phage-related protein